ncbi:monocarboxylate permease-like protein [Calycina marina]|uniref:Monocarboxylate permease-like protein n=1 Tax=Calycina marina TaxID=1763456 RepID=A0A9P8CGB7_9HELO|nr:monocarboxylate permease-like protein [Calycina marina]
MNDLPQPPLSTTFHDVEFQHDPATSSGQVANMSKHDATTDFPDGGREAWLVVLGGWCGLFVSFGWITCIGVFQTYYTTTLLSAYSSSTIAWIPSFETFALFIGAPLFGRLFDSYGPRWLLVGGSFFHVLGLMMVSLSGTYWQVFLAQSVCSALGAGAVFWACNNAVGTWFGRRRGLAMGVLSSGSSVGGVVGTASIPTMIEKVGFGWSMRIVAFMFLFLLSITILTVRSRLVHKPSKMYARDIVTPLKEMPVWTLSIAAFFFFLGVFLPYNFLVVEAVDKGMSPKEANNLLVILSSTSIIGRIIPGWLGDRYGRFNIMILTTYLSSLLVLAFWIPAPSNAARLGFSGLYGFSSGTFVSMIPTLIVQVCADLKHIGAYMGAVYLVLCPAILFGQPIGGALAMPGYVWMKVFSGMTMFMGGVGFVVARSVYIRRKGRVGWRI